MQRLSPILVGLKVPLKPKERDIVTETSAMKFHYILEKAETLDYKRRKTE